MKDLYSIISEAVTGNEPTVYSELGCSIYATPGVAYDIKNGVVYVSTVGSSAHQITFVAAGAEVNLVLNVTGDVGVFVGGEKLKKVTLQTTGTALKKLVFDEYFGGVKKIESIDISGVHDCAEFLVNGCKKLASIQVPAWRTPCWVRVEKSGLTSLDMSSMKDCRGGFIIKNRNLKDVRISRIVSGNLNIEGCDVTPNDLGGLKTVTDKGTVWMKKPNNWTIVSGKSSYFYDKAGNLKKAYSNLYYTDGGKIVPMPASY